MSASIDLWYDASCALCRAEIEALVATDRAARIRAHDCSAPGFRDELVERSGIPREALMTVMHARDEGGVWHVGVDAFVAIYRAAGLEAVAALWANPLLKPLWRRLYPIVARNRYVLDRFGFARLVRILMAAAARRAAMRRCDGESCGADRSDAA